jgi:hypothetical protein
MACEAVTLTTDAMAIVSEQPIDTMRVLRLMAV